MIWQSSCAGDVDGCFNLPAAVAGEREDGTEDHPEERPPYPRNG